MIILYTLGSLLAITLAIIITALICTRDEKNQWSLEEESIALTDQIKDVRIPNGKSHTITITGANKPLFTEDDKEIVEELNKYINK